MSWGFFLICAATSALASPAGQIDSVTGSPNVAIETQGVARTVAKGADIFENDRITTTVDQTVVLLMQEKTQVIIGPSSQLLIEHFVNGGPHRTTLDLMYGLMRTWVRKKIGDDDSFIVKTPDGVMGVRGTNFITEVRRSQDTTVHTLEGRVVLASTAAGLTDPAQSVVVGAGQTSSIRAGAALPTPVQSYDPREYRDNLNKRAPQFENAINPAQAGIPPSLNFPNGLAKPKKK